MRNCKKRETKTRLIWNSVITIEDIFEVVYSSRITVITSLFNWLLGLVLFPILVFDGFVLIQREYRNVRCNLYFVPVSSQANLTILVSVVPVETGMTFRCKPENCCMWFNVITIYIKSMAYGIHTRPLGRVSRPTFYFPSYCVIDTRILVPISTSLVCIQCYHNSILRRLNRGSECNIFQAPGPSSDN